MCRDSHVHFEGLSVSVSKSPGPGDIVSVPESGGRGRGGGGRGEGGGGRGEGGGGGEVLCVYYTIRCCIHLL